MLLAQDGGTKPLQDCNIEKGGAQIGCRRLEIEQRPVGSAALFCFPRGEQEGKLRTPHFREESVTAMCGAMMMMMSVYWYFRIKLSTAQYTLPRYLLGVQAISPMAKKSVSQEMMEECRPHDAEYKCVFCATRALFTLLVWFWYHLGFISKIAGTQN